MPHKIARIISLTPSVTELVVALGMTNQLVGRDQYSVTPKEILSLPVLGDFLSPNVEAIAQLSPDLVVMDQAQSRAQEALQTLGVSTLSLPMHKVSDVRSGLIEVGKAAGAVAEAQQLVTVFDRTIADFTQRGQERDHHPTVLLIIDRAPDSLQGLVAAGPTTYLDELLTLVGARNAMSASLVPYPQLSAEQIMRLKPEVIIDLSKSPGGRAAYDQVREVAALVHGRLHFVEEPLLLSPSPRLGEALEQLFALTAM